LQSADWGSQSQMDKLLLALEELGNLSQSLVNNYEENDGTLLRADAPCRFPSSLCSFVAASLALALSFKTLRAKLIHERANAKSDAIAAMFVIR